MNIEKDSLKSAVGWAAWTVENTEMGMARILRRASEKFSVPQTQIRKYIESAFSDEYLRDRAEKMKIIGRKYAPPEVKENMRRQAKLYKENVMAERHIRSIQQEQ